MNTVKKFQKLQPLHKTRDAIQRMYGKQNHYVSQQQIS